MEPRARITLLTTRTPRRQTAQVTSPQQAHWEWADQLRADANDTASHVRHLYISFLLLGMYIAVIIGSTTDEQLLRISPVTLPLLDVGLPILWFYALIPWLLLLLHFHLLLQFYLLACKPHRVDEAIAALPDETAQNAQRTQFSSFPFVQMLIGSHHGRLVRVLLAIMVWVTVILLPLSLLLEVCIRFLAYQSALISWFQGGAVMTDLLLLWVFWPMLVEPGGRARRWWVRIGTSPVRWARGLWATIQAGWWLLMRSDKKVQAGSDEPRARGFLALITTSLMAGAFLAGVTLALVTAGVPLSSPLLMDRIWISHSLLRSLDLEEKILVDGEPSPAVFVALQSKDKVTRENALQQVLGLTLAGRNLKAANFSRATLPKADLRGADLRGANLQKANLWGANLQKANLQKANLQKANLQEANLQKANLQKADLQGADLQGANLQKANLWGADLWETNLQWADLQGANLQKANLQKAKLWGANWELAFYSPEVLSVLGLPPDHNEQLAKELGKAK